MKLGDNLRIYRDIIFDNVFRYAYENSIPKPMLTTVKSEWIGTKFDVSNMENDLHWDIRDDLKNLNMYDDIIKYCDKYVILPDVFSMNPIPITFERNQYDMDRRNIVIINNKLFELYDIDKKTFKYNHNGKLYYFFKESEMEGFFDNIVENNNNFISAMYINEYGWASDKISSSWIEKYKDDKLLKIFINKDNKASEDPNDPILGYNHNQNRPNLAGICFAYPYIELDYSNISLDSFPDIPGHKSIGWRDVGMRPKWFNMENGRYNIYDPDSIMTTTAFVLLKDGSYYAENLYSNPVGKYVERVGKHNIEVKQDPNIKKVFMFIKPYGKAEFVKPDTTYYEALNKNQRSAKHMRKYACRTDRLYEYLLGNTCMCVDDIIKYGYENDLDVLKVIQNSFPHIVDLDNSAIILDKFYGYSNKLPEDHPEVKAWKKRLADNKSQIDILNQNIAEVNASKIYPKPAVTKTVWRKRLVDVETKLNEVKEDLTETYIPERKINLDVDFTFEISPILDIVGSELAVKAILRGIKHYNKVEPSFFDLKNIIKQFCDKCGTATIRSDDVYFTIYDYSIKYDVIIPFTKDVVIDKKVKDNANNIFYLMKDKKSDVGDNIIDDIWGLVVYAYKGDGQDVISDNNIGYDNLENKLVLDVNKVYNMHQVIDYFKHTTKIFDNSKHDEPTKIIIKCYAVPKMDTLKDIPNNNLDKWDNIDEAIKGKFSNPEIINKYITWNDNIENGFSNNRSELTEDSTGINNEITKRRIKYELERVHKTREINMERPARPVNNFPFTSVINISWYSNDIKCTLSYNWSKKYRYGQDLEPAKLFNFKGLLEMFYNNISTTGILNVTDPIFDEFKSTNKVIIENFAEWDTEIKLTLSHASADVLAKYKADPSMVKEAVGVKGNDFDKWIKSIWGVALSKNANDKLKNTYGFTRDFKAQTDIDDFNNDEIKNALCIGMESNYILTEFINFFHVKVNTDNKMILDFTLIPKSAIKHNMQLEDKYNLKHYKKLPYKNVNVLSYIKNEYLKYINNLNKYNNWTPDSKIIQHYVEELEKIYRYIITYKKERVSREFKEKEIVEPEIKGNLNEVYKRLEELNKRKQYLVEASREPHPSYRNLGNIIDEIKLNELITFITGFKPIAKDGIRNNEVIFILNELEKVINEIKTSNKINEVTISTIIKNKLSLLKDILHPYTLRQSSFNMIRTYYNKLDDLINYNYFYRNNMSKYNLIPSDYEDVFWHLKYQFHIWNPLQKYPALFIGNRLYDQDYKIIKNFDADILIVDPRELIKFMKNEAEIMDIEDVYFKTHNIDRGVDLDKNGRLKPYIAIAKRIKDPWDDLEWIESNFKNIFKLNRPRVIFTDYPYNKIERKDGTVWLSKQSGKITRDLYKDSICCLDKYSDYNWKSQLKGVNFVNGYRSLELESPYGVQYSAPIEDGYVLGPWYSKYENVKFTGHTKVWLGDADTYYYNAPDISVMNPVQIPKLDTPILRDYRYIAFDKQGEECTDRVKLLSTDYIDMNFMKNYDIDGLLPRPSVSIYFPNLDDYMYGYDLNIDKSKITAGNVGFANDRIMSDHYIQNLFDPTDTWENGVKSFGNLIDYTKLYDKNYILQTYSFMSPEDINDILYIIDHMRHIGNMPYFNHYKDLVGQIEVINKSHADYIEDFNHSQSPWIKSSNLPVNATVFLDPDIDIEHTISPTDYNTAALKDADYLDINYYLKHYYRTSDDYCITYTDDNGFNKIFINKYLIPLLFKDQEWIFTDTKTFDTVLQNVKTSSFHKAISSIINLEHTSSSNLTVRSFNNRIHYTNDIVHSPDIDVPSVINDVLNNTLSSSMFNFIYNNIPQFNDITKTPLYNMSRFLDNTYSSKLKHIYTISLNSNIFNNLSTTIQNKISSLLNNNHINSLSPDFISIIKKITTFQSFLDFLSQSSFTDNLDDIIPNSYFTYSRNFINTIKSLIDNIYYSIQDYI